MGYSRVDAPGREETYLYKHGTKPSDWMPLLSPEEIDAAITDLATIAWDAYRCGVTARVTFEALDQLTFYRLNARWRRIQYALISPELVFQRRYRTKYSEARLPRELNPHTSPMTDIFAASMKQMTETEVQRDREHSGIVLLAGEGSDELHARFVGRVDAFLAPFEQRMEDARKRHLAQQAADEEALVRARDARALARPHPVPQALPYGVSPRGAELLVADWMRHLGILDAAVTRERGDGGIDVTSQTSVAQVKHYKGRVSVIEVRELFGVAASLRKQPLFFTSAGYTAEAIAFASATGMSLFVYSAELGTLKGMTPPAVALL